MNKLTFECIECGKIEDVWSTAFNGRVKATCVACLENLKNEEDEGPVYKIDLGGVEDITFYPDQYKKPEATITSLFLMEKCNQLEVNARTGVVEGFTFEEILSEGYDTSKYEGPIGSSDDDNSVTVSVNAKIIDGPTTEDLRYWYNNRNASKLVTRHVPEISMDIEVELNKKSSRDLIYESFTFARNVKVFYCTVCKVVVRSHSVLHESHNRIEMDLVDYLNSQR